MSNPEQCTLKLAWKMLHFSKCFCFVRCMTMSFLPATAACHWLSWKLIINNVAMYPSCCRWSMWIGVRTSCTVQRTAYISFCWVRESRSTHLIIEREEHVKTANSIYLSFYSIENIGSFPNVPTVLGDIELKFDFGHLRTVYLVL